MKASYFKHNLKFKIPGKTSRNVLSEKPSWFLLIENENKIGIGECSIIPGLSIDNIKNINLKLKQVCEKISSGKIIEDKEIEDYPAIKFAIETALRDLNYFDEPFKLFDSSFSNFNDSIRINGLVWMGDIEYMETQIRSKINDGFNCIKIKVGALDFESEFEMIKKIRKKYLEKDLEIRLDANGAFDSTDALEKLKRLNEFSIHSVEQPIKTNQWQEMAHLCEFSPIPIGLDEELIGIYSNRKSLLETINPEYLILKPSLLGGFKDCDNWISLAKEKEIKWWATSALEGNVGLNAIAQWVYTKNNKLRQGLGTGMLFKNNVNSPLEISADSIYLNENKEWDLNFFKKIDK